MPVFVALLRTVPPLLCIPRDDFVFASRIVEPLSKSSSQVLADGPRERPKSQ